MSKRALYIVFNVVLLSACAAPSVRTALPPSAVAERAAGTASIPLPNDNLNAVAWTQTAVEHDLIVREIYRMAGAQLLEALKDPAWDALPQEERTNSAWGLSPAVILDVDETVLDNSPYQARLINHNAEFDEYTWSQWCREKAAKALPGALEFAQLAVQHGVRVFYLSNRAQDLAAVTLENLRADGFPLDASEDAFRGLGTIVSGCEQIGSEKGCRRRKIGRAHRVLLQIGDQLGDFIEVLANTPQGRRAAITPYVQWIGTRWFVLPNPTYGSWEPALFNNEWSLPATQRRKIKIEALDK